MIASARQKEEALGSIIEVVQTVKDPKSHISSQSPGFNLEYMLPGPAEIENKSTPGRHTPELDGKSNLSRSGSRQDTNKSRKSARVSLLG